MPDILEKLIIPLVLLAGQLWLNSRFKRYDQRHENERAAKEERHVEEAMWRESVNQRMDFQDSKLDMLSVAQVSTMGADILHKYHRYMDDLGGASVEEKDAFYAQWKDYVKLCEACDIENGFIDGCVADVMALPDRKPKDLVLDEPVDDRSE